MARFRAALAPLACVALVVSGVALVVSGCVSATAVDLRLTRAAREASPRQGQAPAQQVADAAACREGIMDRLLYVGAYALYNPVRYGGSGQLLHGLQSDLARCLRDRGYAIDDPPGPPPAERLEHPIPDEPEG